MIDFEKIGKRLEADMPRIKDKFDAVILQSLQSTLRRRIFNEGKATEGEEIGQYSTDYALLREQEGFQTSRVDLERSGELRRSVQVGKIGNEQVLGIKQTRYPDEGTTDEIAEFQEQNFGKEIFTLSDAEIEEAYKDAEASIIKDIDELINKALNEGTA